MRVSHVSKLARTYQRMTGSLHGIAAIFLLISAVSVASSGVGQAQTFRFTTVAIEGNELIDDQTIASFARIVRNRSMSASELNAAYQRVAGTGFFRTVEFIPSGSRLTIQVEEYPLVNRISIEGNRRLDDEELLAVLQSRPGSVYSSSQAEADANSIADAYATAGRLAATVEPRLIQRGAGRVDLVFEVAEGQVVEIERIAFVGNRSFSERRLRNVVASAQAGRLSTLFRVDNYDAQRVARDRQSLQDFYLSQGFVDAQVLSGVTELSRERDGAFVTFTIREGQQYRIGNLNVVSEIAGIEPGAYQAAMSDRTGEIFTPSRMESLIQQIERVGYDSGQRFVRAEPRLSRDERAGTIDIEFALVRGDRVFIERIDIQGNVNTQDAVIRRQFHVAEGDPLNPRELREAAARIQSTGFFRDVQVNPVPGSSPQQAVVDVQVEETPTGSLGFGLSFGVEDGIGANINYDEANFLGRGQRLGVNISTVSDARSLSFTFTDPSILGRDLALSLEGGLSRSTASGDTRFGTQVYRFAPSLSFPTGEYSRMAVRYAFERTTIDVNAANADPNLEPVPDRLRQDDGFFYTSSIGATYTYDTRRNGPNPDAGFVFRFAQDIAGLGGDRQWSRSTLLAGYQRRAFNGDVTLRAEFEAGALLHRGGPSRITERFSLSGEQFRGFAGYGLGPVGYGADGSRNGLGGNYYAVARFEAEFPLGLPQEYNMHGGLFLDVGSLWGLDNPGPACAGGTPPPPNPGVGGCVIDDNAIRAAAGFSLFWRSPLGPLRFNFAVPLMMEDYDQERRFDLTIATNF